MSTLIHTQPVMTFSAFFVAWEWSACRCVRARISSLCSHARLLPWQNAELACDSFWDGTKLKDRCRTKRLFEARYRTVVSCHHERHWTPCNVEHCCVSSGGIGGMLLKETKGENVCCYYVNKQPGLYFAFRNFCVKANAKHLLSFVIMRVPRSAPELKSAYQNGCTSTRHHWKTKNSKRMKK